MSIFARLTGADFMAARSRPAYRLLAAAERTLPGLSFELISDRAAFDRLEAEWNALFARSARPTHVFQSFNWNWHWANHYLASSPGGIAGLELSILVGRRHGELVTVWPLVKQRVRGVTQIFWMGEPASQYGDVLIDDASLGTADTMALLRDGWKYLLAHADADILRLRRVRADATIAPLLQEMGAEIADRQVAPYLDLASAPSFDDYEKRYSGHARKNRRRLRRRLEERAALHFKRLHGGADAARFAVEALAFKSDWLKHRGLVSQALADPRMVRFFAAAALGGERSTNCIVSVLQSGEATAAVEIAFACKGRLAMHVIAYNLDFEKSGAGVVLMEQGLRDAFSEGLGVCDMLAPGDAYKGDWADAVMEVCDWVKPLNAVGTAYTRVYLGLLRGKAKTALKACPQSIRRIVSRAAAFVL